MADRRATFVTTYLPYAQEASKITGIDPMVILAQAAHETAWGRKAPGNNFFGIKGGGQTFATHEYVNGKRVNMKAGFRRYDSPLGSFLDWAKLMQTPRYAGVLAAKTPEEQIKALKAAGYATDPRYVSKLLSVRKQVASISGAPAEGVAAKNPAVAQLQTFLAQNGFDPGSADGIMGPKTLTALNAYNAKAAPQIAAAAQQALASSGVTNPTPQQMADAFNNARQQRTTAMAMAPAPVQTPAQTAVAGLASQSPGDLTADAIDQLTLVDENGNYVNQGGGQESMLGGTMPPTPRPRDQSVLEQQRADQLDAAIFGTGPHRGDARANPQQRNAVSGAPVNPPDPTLSPRSRAIADALDAGPNLRPGPQTFEWLDGGAPDNPPNPPPRPDPFSGRFPSAYGEQPQPAPDGGVPSEDVLRAIVRGAPTAPRPMSIKERADSQGPNAIAGWYTRNNPDSPEAAEQRRLRAEQMVRGSMVAGRPEFPGALPAASRQGDLSAAMGNMRPGFDPTDVGALIRADQERRDSSRIADALDAGFADLPAPTPRVGNLNYSDMPPPPGPSFDFADPGDTFGMPRPTQGAATEPSDGYGPYGTNMPVPSFDFAGAGDTFTPPSRQTVTERVMDILNPPDTTGIDLYRPNNRQALTAALLEQDPWRRDAGPSWWERSAQTEVPEGWRPRSDAEPSAAFDPPTDEAYRWFHGYSRGYTGEGGAFPNTPPPDASTGTVARVGGPRQTSAPWSQPGSGQWMTDNDMISIGLGVDPSYYGGDLAGSDAEDAVSPSAQITADALDAADTGGMGGQPLIGSYGAMGTTAPQIDIADYHPGAMVINEPGASIADRPVGSGSMSFAEPASVQTGGDGPGVTVAPPDLGGGRLNGKSGGLFGLGANWAGPQWTGGVTTDTTPGGQQWWRGETNAMGGTPATTWQTSDGRTVTAYQNTFGQPGYTMGYGPV